MKLCHKIQETEQIDSHWRSLGDKVIFDIALCNKSFFRITKDENRICINILGIKIKKKIKPKTIAVVRFQGIGDYLLMHNFLHEIKNSTKYKNYKLILGLA